MGSMRGEILSLEKKYLSSVYIVSSISGSIAAVTFVTTLASEILRYAVDASSYF
jgi:hypothetical protein